MMRERVSAVYHRVTTAIGDMIPIRLAISCVCVCVLSVVRSVLPPASLVTQFFPYTRSCERTRESGGGTFC